MKYDIAIVGAGVAGMTAAIYAKRAGKNVVIFESLACGGQVVQTEKIKNYPGFESISGAELTEKIYHQVNNLGAEIKREEVLDCKKNGDIFEIETDEDKYQAGVVIIAVGVKNKPIGAKNEARLVGKGVSYCATCDGALCDGENVAVVGGGNTALYSVLYLADLAKKVYLINKRTEFKGDKVLVEQVKSRKNVEIVLNTMTKEIIGDEKVEGLKMDCDGTERIIDVKGVFVAVGKKPATEKFAGLVELDRSGYVIAGEDCKTSCKRVYVAGDCRAKSLYQLVTATADGANAASEAVKDLE